MKIGDRVEIVQVNEPDGYFYNKKEVIGLVGTITRIHLEREDGSFSGDIDVSGEKFIFYSVKVQPVPVTESPRIFTSSEVDGIFVIKALPYGGQVVTESEKLDRLYKACEFYGVRVRWQYQDRINILPPCEGYKLKKAVERAYKQVIRLIDNRKENLTKIVEDAQRL